MSATTTNRYGPWDGFWDVVVPWEWPSDWAGIFGAVFWAGVAVLFFLAIKKKSVEVYLMLASWLIVLGALMCFQGMMGTFEGSHDFWKYAFYELSFGFGGFCVRTFGILFLCGVPVFWRQSWEQRKTGWMVLPILSILFLLSFSFLTIGLLWYYLLATRYQG